MKFLDALFRLTGLTTIVENKTGLGKRADIQLAAARKPAQVHTYTRQQRRAELRRMAKDERSAQKAAARKMKPSKKG